MNLLAFKDTEIERLRRVEVLRDEAETNFARCLDENNRFSDAFAALDKSCRDSSLTIALYRKRLIEYRCERSFSVQIVHAVFAIWATIPSNRKGRALAVCSLIESKSTAKTLLVLQNWRHFSMIRMHLIRRLMDRLFEMIRLRISWYLREFQVNAIKKRNAICLGLNKLILTVKSACIRSIRNFVEMKRRPSSSAALMHSWAIRLKHQDRRSNFANQVVMLRKRKYSENAIKEINRRRILKIFNILTIIFRISLSHKSTIALKAYSPPLPETDSMASLVACIALRDALVSCQKSVISGAFQFFRHSAKADSPWIRRCLQAWRSLTLSKSLQQRERLCAVYFKKRFRLLSVVFISLRRHAKRPDSCSKITKVLQRHIFVFWSVLTNWRSPRMGKLDFVSFRHCNILPIESRSKNLRNFAIGRILMTAKRAVGRYFSAMRLGSQQASIQLLFFLDSIRRVVNVVRLREKWLQMYAIHQLRHNVLIKDNVELAVLAERTSGTISVIKGVQTEGDIDQELDAYADIAFELEQQLKMSEGRNADLQDSLAKLKENYSLLLLSRPVIFRDG